LKRKKMKYKEEDEEAEGRIVRGGFLEVGSKVYQTNRNFPLPSFGSRRPQKEASSYKAIANEE
jgi:hypothetical protein